MDPIVVGGGLLLVAILVLAGGAAALRDWRAGVLILLAWMLLEDPVRKLVPGQSILVTLAKDAYVLLLYLALFLRGGFAGWRFPLRTIALVWALFVFLQCFNPASAHPLLGLSGVRVELFFLPLAFLGYRLFSDPRQILRWTERLTVVVYVVAVPAAYAYFVGPRGLPVWLQPFRGGSESHGFSLARGTFTLIPLTPGLFGSAEILAAHLLFLVAVGVGLWLVPARRRWRLRGSLPILVAVAGIFVSGRRAPFFLALALPLGPLIGILLADASARRALYGRILGATAAVGCLGFLLVQSDPADPGAEIGQHVEFFASTRNEVTERAALISTEFARVSIGAQLLGHGTGNGGQERFAINFIDPREGRRLGAHGDSGPNKILYEFGAVGLLLFAIFYAGCLVSALRSAFGTTDPMLRPLAFALVSYMGLTLIWFVKAHPILSQNSILIPFWLAFGVVHRLPVLARVSRPLSRPSIPAEP